MSAQPHIQGLILNLMFWSTELTQQVLMYCATSQTLQCTLPSSFQLVQLGVAVPLGPVLKTSLDQCLSAKARMMYQGNYILHQQEMQG